MKMIKYFMVGFIAAITDISLFYLFTRVSGYNYLIVAFFSFVIATLVNYILSIKYVFQSQIKFSKKQEISLIYLVSGMAIIINQISLFILIDLFSMEMISSKVMATVLIFFWNYYLRSNFIFKEEEKDSKGKESISVD